jgi:hypothetical protein
MYRVTYKAFEMDDKPVVKKFDEWHEAEEWVQDEIARRVDWRVQHTSYYIDDSAYGHFHEEESSLVRVDRI